MAVITEEYRIREFEYLKRLLEAGDIAAKILHSDGVLDESCLIISMPTTSDDLDGLVPSDLHMAKAYLSQSDDEDEDTATKYLSFIMPIQVDLKDVDEYKMLKYLNECNECIPFGTCYYSENPLSGRMLVQVKWAIGGVMDEPLNANVFCDTVCELGFLYDSLKEELLEKLPSLTRS